MKLFSLLSGSRRRGAVLAVGFLACAAVTGFVPSFGSAAHAQTAATAQPLTYGPVHRYTFSGYAAGTANSGDLLLDSVGVAHGVLRGSGASYTSTGLRLLGGDSGSAAYVELPKGIISGSATSYPGYTSASYEFWVTVYGNLNWSRVFDFGSGTVGKVNAPGGTQTGTDYLMLAASVGTSGTVQFERSNGMPGGGLATLANGSSVGSEIHVVVVYDATAGVWKWYKNGVSQGQFTCLLSPDTILDDNNWLGRSNFAADSNANVSYREFRIYDYALTDNQVLGDYQAGASTLTSPVGNTSPFAWYRLNESGGVSAADSSGSGNVGALSATGATFVSGGITSPTALSLSNGYVRVSNSVALVNPTGAVTMAAWIKPSNWIGNRRIIQKGASTTGFRLTGENSLLTFSLDGTSRIVTAALPAVNTWTHVAAVYDGAAMRLYVNGSPAATVNATGALPVTSDDLFIGASSASAILSEKFQGLMDDVRLYDRALNPVEINTLATSVAVAPSTASIQEGTGTPGAVTVTRTGSLASPLAVSLSQAVAAGQAALNTRFSLTPSTLNLTIPAGQSSASVTVTPLADTAIRGTESVTLVASPGGGYFLNASATSATIQLLDSVLNTWKIAHFGSIANAQSLGADGADPDNDGLSNLLEYALNADPMKADASGLTSSSVENGSLTFTYNRLKNAPDITYHLLSSSNLAAWTEPTVTETILSDDGQVQRVKATFPAGGAQGFAKLQVQRK